MIGALARVGLAEAAPHGPASWPWATFAANMAGALLLGYFVARLRDHREEQLRPPFLTTGICGTLTTFATLQLELFEMLDAGTSASPPPTSRRPSPPATLWSARASASRSPPRRRGA